MIKKKVLSLALTSCLLLTGLPLSADAAYENSVNTIATNDSINKSLDSTNTTQAETTGLVNDAEHLKEIISKVKSKINITKDLTRFDYNFSSDVQTYWYLSWNNEKYTKNVNVQVDDKGNIISYNSYNNQDGFYGPKYLQTELKSKANSFLKKIAPEIYKKVKYTGCVSQGVYSGQYVYQYDRFENGLPMTDNSISIGVNFETGAVDSYYCTWLYDVEVPSSDSKITKSQAKDTIDKEITMELGYYNKYTTDKDGNMKIEAFLAYAPDKSYIAVDAKTGEVYTAQSEWDDKYDSMNYSMADSKAKESGLTQQEIFEAEELSDIISKEKAIKAITDNMNLLLDENLEVISARLYKRGSYYYGFNEEAKYVWDITFTDPREVNYEKGDYYRAYANACVDAKTGKLISFYSSTKDYTQSSESEIPKVNYTKEQGKTILESFLKDQIPDLFKNVVLTDKKDSYILGYKDGVEIYGGYDYNYERVNEGINYSSNGINASVDGVTGKIYSYSYNWNSKISFESPKKIISDEEAFKNYIANDGFQLTYEANTIYSDNNSKDVYQETVMPYSINSEIRLVYKTNIYPNLISPFTGKQLDYEGNEYKDSTTNYSYSDIKGIKSERNIKILADLGIGYSGGKFSPNKEITQKELIEFLSKMGYYYDTSKYNLKNTNAKISRTDVAKFLIQILNLENVAKVKDIYKVNFKDVKKISSKNIGYLALAEGLGLLSTNSSNEIRPNDNLTRSEAADMIIALLFVQ